MPQWRSENAGWKNHSGGPGSHRAGNQVGSFQQPAAGPRVENHRGDDSLLLPGSSRRREYPMPRVPATARLRGGTTGTLPVWSGEADLRQLSCPLLSEGTAGTGQSGNALRRATHVMATSHPEPDSLAGRLPQSARNSVSSRSKNQPAAALTGLSRVSSMENCFVALTACGTFGGR